MYYEGNEPMNLNRPAQPPVLLEKIQPNIAKYNQIQANTGKIAKNSLRNLPWLVSHFGSAIAAILQAVPDLTDHAPVKPGQTQSNSVKPNQTHVLPSLR